MSHYSTFVFVLQLEENFGCLPVCFMFCDNLICLDYFYFYVREKLQKCTIFYNFIKNKK